MTRKNRGYTLIELVVVVLIIGVLASFGVPQFLRTVETGKADDAVALVNQIGMTNRMFALDHGGFYAVGQFSATCTGAGTCPAGAIAANQPACVLVWCKYLADQDWANKPYRFHACNPATVGSCGTVTVAGVRPVSAAKRAATAYSPYVNWGYLMSDTGVISGSPASGADAAPTPTY